MNKIKNVFISHYHKDEENIQKMKDLLGDKYTIKNSSVTSDKFNRAQNKEYIEGLLRDRIAWAETCICLIGPKTHDSEWVDYEIRTAHRQGKQIIGVYIWGATDADVPEALNDYADSIVGWNKESIEKALNGERSFTNANGSPRTERTSPRHIC